MMIQMLLGLRLVHLYSLIAVTGPVLAGDPTQEHPISDKSSNPPSCLWSWPDSNDNCNFTSTKVADCTYRHCHTDLGTTCSDWWTVLNINCLCNGIGSTHCNQRCPPGLQETMYFDFLVDTCSNIPSWSGLPPDSALGLPSSVIVLPTNLYIQSPSCLASADVTKFRSCAANTTDVVRWLSDQMNVDSSNPWQLDQSCFCGNLTYADVLNRSTCAAGDDVARAQLLIWLNTYCGSYQNFADQAMPPNWQSMVPVFNSSFQTYSQPLIDSWNSTGLSSSSTCEQSFSSLLSECGLERTCKSTSDCNSPILATNGTCFCGSSYPIQNAESEWCNGNHINLIKSETWYESTCNITPQEYPAIWLLPWSHGLQPSTLETNLTTNLAVGPDSPCPSNGTKLGAFAAVNAVMALLVPLLGRRTVANKMTRGVLGRAQSQTWIIMGLLGVSLHLLSNVVNAKIIQNTTGYESVSVGHLVLLWCTRPRLAWLVVACIPLQADRAMYFAVTAATLTTECILQLIGVVYMGIVTNYGRLAHLYSSEMLATRFSARSHDAHIMYAGSVFSTVVAPFAMLVIAGSALNISEIIRKQPSYVLHMNKTAKRLGKVAQENTAKYSRLSSDPSCLEKQSHSSEEYLEHCELLQRQWISLEGRWRALHASIIPIPKELRRDRKERATEVQRQSQNQRSSLHLQLKDLNTPWFQNPNRRARDNKAQALHASNKADEVEERFIALIDQIQSSEVRMNELKKQEKVLLQQIEEVTAETDLLMISLRDVPAWRQDRARGDQRLSYQEGRRIAVQNQHNTLQSEIRDLDNTLSQYYTLEQLYSNTKKSWHDLAECWRTMAERWEQVGMERDAEADKEQLGNRLIRIPVIVVCSMLVLWIAQWVWWIGYVHVARDTYCPPKLASIAIVWTVFSALSVVLGAHG